MKDRPVIDRLVPRWYVVFVGDGSEWFHRFLRPGFKHCFCYGYDDVGERWMLVDPGFDRVAVVAMTFEEAGRLLKLVDDRGWPVVRVPVVGETVRRPRLLLSCVSAVAAMVGLRTRAVTPWGLFRDLQKRGFVSTGGFHGKDPGRRGLQARSGVGKAAGGGRSESEG